MRLSRSPQRGGGEEDRERRGRRCNHQEGGRAFGTKIKHAATALSGSAVITKVIPMSATLSDAEMEAQIQFESDQYIPYPIEEVNIDFDVLGSSDSGANLVDVLLAASRRENVNDRVAALEIAGLSAAIVDEEAYTMESACTLLPTQGSGHWP